MKKSKDLIDFEKIRNYCNPPWISTRVAEPEEGVPVLIAYHVKRNVNDVVHEGFDGYAVSIGARYVYREEILEVKEDDGTIKKVKSISCHFGKNISNDRLVASRYELSNVVDYLISGGGSRWSSVDDMRESRTGSNCYGIKDPYLRKNISKIKNGSSYWVDISKGTTGDVFNNSHSGDRSYVPETTVKKMLNSKDRSISCMTIQNDATSSITVCSPDFWMPIPALR